MASIQLDRKRRHWRVAYTIYLPAGTHRRSRYCGSRAKADGMRRALEGVEGATRAGMASADQMCHLRPLRFLAHPLVRHAGCHKRQATRQPGGFGNAGTPGATGIGFVH